MTEEWFSASAPGKFVILGEHAVVYGKPALVLAADRRVYCSVRRSKSFTMNGTPLDVENQPHIKFLTNDLDCKLDLKNISFIPSGAGMGSSAAFSAALSMAIRRMNGKETDDKAIVDDAYGAELFAQGSGSPMDASACVHGGGIAVNIPDAENVLWTISRNGRTWTVSDIPAPELTFVIGYTGVKAPTGPQVDKVRRYKDKCSFASEIIDEIGKLTLKGYDALMRCDKSMLGAIMTENHKLLSILGVSCEDLNKLVKASLPYSYGAKLTGSGGGGCMVALTDQPQKVASSILARGGTPYIIRCGAKGVSAEDKIPSGPSIDFRY